MADVNGAGHSTAQGIREEMQDSPKGGGGVTAGEAGLAYPQNTGW